MAGIRCGFLGIRTLPLDLLAMSAYVFDAFFTFKCSTLSVYPCADPFPSSTGPETINDL